MQCRLPAAETHLHFAQEEFKVKVIKNPKKRPAVAETQNVTCLLGKELPGTFVEVPTQPVDETDGKVRLVLHVMEMGQTVVHHTHHAGLHHQVIL